MPVLVSGCQRNRSSQRSKRQAGEASGRTYMAFAIRGSIKGNIYLLFFLCWFASCFLDGQCNRNRNKLHYMNPRSNTFNCEQKNLEEEKGQEIAKLQEALQAMQLQIDEANARVVTEREAAKKAIEEAPPVIKEVPVMVQDTEKVESLTAEVDNLKVNSLIHTDPINSVFHSA